MKNYCCNIVVIFGVTGDLATRKLFPALNDIYNSKELPDNTIIIGCGRKKINKNIFESLPKKLSKSSKYLKLDPSVPDDFYNLNTYVEKYKNTYEKVNVTFYLSTPPNVYYLIINNLISIKLNKEDNGFRRIIIEKPFGEDLLSSKELNKILKNGFKENQIYRIDHYLGKETVQNILVARYSNLIFNALWNNKYISYVEITAAESIGIEKRGEYYDTTGAIKDMFQNHLLELLCLVAMDDPKDNTSEEIRNEKLKVLQKIKKLDFKKNIVRGQYIKSNNSKKSFKGYRENQNVKKDSKTETFFACKLFIDNSRWRDIPFFIRTGKRLPTKVTEIVINFKKNKNIYSNKNESNMLIFRIQPDEGLLIKFNLKKPGVKKQLLKKTLEFHYKNLNDGVITNAYERLILDVFKGETLLFSRSDFVEKAWEIVDPIINAIKKENLKLYGYKAGTWGPEQSNDLFRNKNNWRYPCKNLVDDGKICEL